MKRAVLHIDMDAFFAAIEERDNPHFLGKPIVVGADPKGGHGRGVVSTANYAARKFGIKSATPISTAYKFCPAAVFLPVDMQRYVRVSQRIMALLKQFAEKFEQVSVDEAFLELSSTQNPEEIAHGIKKKISETERLTCSIGIGPNKLTAKIASAHQKPDGLTFVRQDKVQDFLNPKPADVIPGIGPKTYSQLISLGITTIKDLGRLSKEKLVELFGKNGASIWEKARGIDESPVGEFSEIKSVGRQTTFEEDTDSPNVIMETTFKLLLEVFDQLKEENLQGKTVTVVIRFKDFETHTSQKSTTELLTFAKAKQLTMQLLLPFFGKKRKIRLVGVRISGF